MKIIDVVAERNYSVVVGANGPDEIKSIAAEHRKVLLVAPATLIKLFKLKVLRYWRVFGVSALQLA
jgi:hypothetical protein